MKKTILITILAALCLTACGADVPAAMPDEGSLPAGDVIDIAPEAGVEGLCWTDEDLPVSARTEQGSYRPDTEEIRVTVMNRTDAEYCFSESEFRLFRMENGQEIEVPFAAGGDCFNDLAQIAPPQDTTVFTAKIAEHYDLPLQAGVYTMHIGTAGEGDALTAGFEISADAPLPGEPEQAALIVLSPGAECCTQGVKEISVYLTNNGSEPAVINLSEFGLEQYLGEAVSYTPYSGAPGEIQVQPGEQYEWNVPIESFGGTKPECGDYAIVYKGQAAKFQLENLPADERTES